MTAGLAAVVVRPDPWRWQPHPEVWLLVGSLVVLAWYAITRIGPKAVRPGEPVVTPGQLVTSRSICANGSSFIWSLPVVARLVRLYLATGRKLAHRA